MERPHTYILQAHTAHTHAQRETIVWSCHLQNWMLVYHAWLLQRYAESLRQKLKLSVLYRYTAADSIGSRKEKEKTLIFCTCLSS